MADSREIDLENPGQTPPVDALLTTLSAPLQRFFRRKVSDPGQAENLVQETWFRILRSVDSFRQGSTLRSWVFAVASNLYRDFLRMRGRAAIPVESLDSVRSRTLAPEDRAMDRELERALVEVVRLLPDKHRKVFILKHHYDLTYTRIGEILGISEGTAKSRMHKASRVVRERMVRRGFLSKGGSR